MGMLELCFTPQFALMHLLSAHWLPFVNALTQCNWLHLLSAPLLVSSDVCGMHGCCGTVWLIALLSGLA